MPEIAGNVAARVRSGRGVGEHELLPAWSASLPVSCRLRRYECTPWRPSLVTLHVGPGFARTPEWLVAAPSMSQTAAAPCCFATRYRSCRAGDFNRDGKTDIVLQSVEYGGGTARLWIVGGARFIGSNIGAALDANAGTS
jgi:hypothetical protein